MKVTCLRCFVCPCYLGRFLSLEILAIQALFLSFDSLLFSDNAAQQHCSSVLIACCFLTMLYNLVLKIFGHECKFIFERVQADNLIYYFPHALSQRSPNFFI